jgi:hypothetical protein
VVEQPAKPGDQQSVNVSDERKVMPQFAILIYAPTPADWASAPDEELEAHGAFGSVMKEMGAIDVAGYALEPSSTAVTARGSQVSKHLGMKVEAELPVAVSNGPAVAAELALGGFGVIEATDIEHAVSIARLNPATRRGAVEVRPVLGLPPKD